MQTEPATTESASLRPAWPQLSVAAAARRLGVAPATLRTWDRRYGLGPSGHTPGRHRRYSPDDLALLELMQHALVRGAAPVDAARYARQAWQPGIAIPAVAEPDLAGSVSDAIAGRPAGLDPRWPGPAAGDSVRVGGTKLRLPGAGRRAQGLARAALMLDPVPVRQLLIEAVDALGVERTWDEVVRPVLGAIAQRWEHSGTGVEIEHLLSECVTAVFGGYAAAAASAGARPVLLAAMAGEQHVLPLSVLAAALARHGVPCRPLGANLPLSALVAAVRRTAPSVVLLWSQLGESADVAALEQLPRTRPRFRTFVAGPGWAGRVLPPRVDRLDSLADARAVIIKTVTV